MGTKTIGITDDVYERLAARKRDDESFTDVVDRLLDEANIDWREGFGTLPADEADELEAIVEQSREATSQGLATRQTEALEALSEADDRDDETA